ncbi:hypothetical protein N7495_008265 [Penicillium taxi]|uniref:uncharacterized protein n=1 Tax=Penicillium taxi TaxID=168475 RepID=UPI0025459C65|nr:uncharacterized protein N7495_008265 [Penicillium taxi]KAJ5888224.1 hypothetical protein N7495_008265 [Penicillium taxi]
MVCRFIEECPHNDLSDLSFDTMLESFEAGYNESASDQCSILSDGSQCVASFSLDTAASTWYNPGELPSGYPGTAPLSETTDAGSITSSPDPYTFSIFPSYITVITPAPYNKKNVAATQTGTTAGTATETATETAATGATASTSTSSPSKGAASNLVYPVNPDFGPLGLAMYTVAFALFGAALLA